MRTLRGQLILSHILPILLIHDYQKESYFLTAGIIVGLGLLITFITIPGLFDSFRQADGSMTRKYGGSGLGLAFASQVIKAHNGKISAENREDGGALFRVEIPIT